MATIQVNLGSQSRWAYLASQLCFNCFPSQWMPFHTGNSFEWPSIYGPLWIHPYVKES